jgi:NTP pyrophosphatase (non-canonical NTP hydrolase)
MEHDYTPRPAGAGTIVPTQGLDLDAYQVHIRRWQAQVGEATAREVGIMGLAGESGELIDIIKKHTAHGVPADAEKILLECGDVLWYLTFLSDQFEVAPHLWAVHPVKAPLPQLAIGLAKYAGLVGINAQAGDFWRSLAGGVVAHLDAIAAVFGYTRQNCIDANVAKLSRRYPAGMVTGGGVR